MQEIADGSIDLTVTSPPYDILRTYYGYSFDFEAVAKELYRVTKQGGVVVLVVVSWLCRFVLWCLFLRIGWSGFLLAVRGCVC